MNKIKKSALLSLSSLLSLLSLSAFASPHVSETLSLAKGWNAVYIESTADESACEDFFRDTPVIAAAIYRSDADASTAQYDTSGKEIVQAPIVFLQWSRGEKDSALQSVVGGNAYLLFATNAATISISGVPAAPQMTWRKVSSSETNELFNLVGVSSASAEVSILDYFGEGPFGMNKAGRAIYSIGGEDPQAPTLNNAEQALFGRTTPIQSGKAYALTSTASGAWPGVIGVQGNGVSFGAGANYASIRVQNCGTKARAFSFAMEPSASGETLPPISRRLPRVDAVNEPGYTNVEESASWTVSLEPDAVTEQVFSIDRSKLVSGTEYGAILVIEDLGGSKMRVRLPIVVSEEPSDAVAYPTGLWVGEIALSKVSGIDDVTPTPVTSGGLLKMSAMMHVDANGKCRLLQRVAAGIDTNGTARLFKDLADVPEAEVENPRRFSTVMMSVDTPVVEAAASSEFGEDADFTWVIGPKARDNPFRHAWHPDHDGKKADYSEDLPAGDDFSLYKNPIKPELWSISNRIDFSWHELGDRAMPQHFPYNADETTSGVVTWEVWGLVSKGPIKSVGTFTLKRVFKAARIEE